MNGERKRWFVSALPLLGRGPAEVLAAAREWEWPGVELVMDGAEWQRPDGAAGEIRRALGGREIPVSLHAPVFEINLANPLYPELRLLAERQYMNALVTGAGIGAKHVVVHPGYGSRTYDRRRAQEYAREHLERLCTAAERLGVLLVIENAGIGPAALFDQEEFEKLIREFASPFCGAIVDVGHAFANGWNIPALLGALGDRVRAMHLHDNHGDADEHLPAGEGRVDWAAVRRAIDALPGPVHLVLEYREDTDLSVFRSHLARWAHGGI
ncbi:MAG: sugar phosphate isomerase/epimerase family protein [Alicyclobacillaceae bacterium]|nr:sugar phosphate isomerase/epimerase family protein [Alicyclobacillaceae bacterium]